MSKNNLGKCLEIMLAQKNIIKHLVDKDRRLKPITQLCPYPKSRKNPDIYLSLLSSIVSQQLSVKAADTIFGRFLDLYPDRYPQPRQLLSTRIPRLRAAGLSQQKTQYLKNVAAFSLEPFSLKQGGLDYQELKRRTDNEIIEHLTQIKGVGQWTVEMLLMFPFDRKDVFPVDDLGIQQAIKKLYRLEHEGRELKQKMLSISDNWRPYRSIACKLLWHWKSLP